MSSIIGTKFGQDILYSAFDRLFGDRQLIGNLLVGVALSDQAKDADFARCESIIGGVFGELVGNLRRNGFPAGMDGSDRVQQFFVRISLLWAAVLSRMSDLSVVRAS